ncbi:hypothetical protein [Bacillus paralicheniformis]
MSLKYTMSQAEIVEAMMQWLQRKGYAPVRGKILVNFEEIRAEFIIREK